MTDLGHPGQFANCHGTMDQWIICDVLPSRKDHFPSWLVRPKGPVDAESVLINSNLGEIELTNLLLQIPKDKKN